MNISDYAKIDHAAAQAASWKCVTPSEWNEWGERNRVYTVTCALNEKMFIPDGMDYFHVDFQTYQSGMSTEIIRGYAVPAE